MASKDLMWARKQGLDCEQDIMAAQLRMQCRNQTQNLLRNWMLIFILLALIFSAAPAKAWSTQDLNVSVASLTSQEPPKIREALPTCAEYVEMDRELRTVGISAVLTRVLGTQGIEKEQLACMLDHVYKIDMTLNNICTSDPGPWKECFVRAVALYAPHCGLEVSR